MANIIIATVINHERVDGTYIEDQQTAGNTVMVRVENEYRGAPSFLKDVSTLSSKAFFDLEATIKELNFLGEDPAIIVKASLENGVHDITASYKRTTAQGVPAALTASEPVLCVISIGWLGTPDGALQLPLTLETGNALNASERSALSDKGIYVNGDGEQFSISGDVPFKIQCVPPVGSIDTYVISHEYDINAAQIITPNEL